MNTELKIKELKSKINRLNGHIEQVANDNIFTQNDRDILLPRYRQILMEFKQELYDYENPIDSTGDTDLKRAKEITVIDAIEVTGTT
ncbi:hypothetical protein ACH3O9_11165 [Leeuwenhoekiella sp. A16]|uniref:hypothetical protein n=1 Tax=Leeuwenhoekiella sp. A16 TaxID=3141462 RepID=UPI003A80983E